MASQTTAKIMVENGCVSPNKALCDAQCKDFLSNDKTWGRCITQCEKDSEAKATAYAQALAQIDVTGYDACTGHADPVGDVWVTLFETDVRRSRS